jgi:beta-N-acetylhexosaminidase
MSAHIVYPQIDAEHPATLSSAVLGGILRDEWGYDGVVITDALMMKAIAERWGYGAAAVLALQAGADMVLAQGSVGEQEQTLAALHEAVSDGRLAAARLAESAARLDALARAYPLCHEPYPPAQHEADDALMRLAWARGLTGWRDAAPPARNEPLRVLIQADVPTDNVAEAGVPAQRALALFSAFDDVEPLIVDDIGALHWNELPRDGRRTVLVSTRRHRYGPQAHGWRPDLHLVLWNPYQVLDVAAPALVTWGYAEGALAAAQAWLEGRAGAPGRTPVTLGTPA